ncbi:MAG TPA: hypothetical protein VD861_04535, partial [Pyrinomonadaceae bacterium]|nr:hypothetical protein [Pyrinomonadaceae bacterium]
ASTGWTLKKNADGTTSWQAGGSGTVTSVALTVPGVIFQTPVSGSPVTGSGTLALSLNTQTANTVFAGPTTGAAAAPTFRAQVAADIPPLDASKITTGALAPARIAGRGARVTHSAAQSLSNNSTTVIAFDTERNDDDTMHDTATNNSRLTIVTAGWYVATANLEFATNATGNRAVGIRLNGTTTIGQTFVASAGASQPTRISITTIYKLAAGDFLEVTGFQSSGGALNVSVTGNLSPEFSALWMGQ